MNVRPLLYSLCLLLPLEALAQGFAGLGMDADGFAIPKPGYEFTFPQDHGPHPEFRIEWWYVTANLTDGAGRNYGLQWTLFRSALAPEERPGWTSPQVWLGHAAVTTPDAHYATERYARGGVGQAGVVAAPFEAWIDEWEFAGADISEAQLKASGPNFAYDMMLKAQGPIVFQGDAGYSVKSAEGQASYYYSQPFYDIAGRLHIPEGEVEVSGHAWLDREWSSQPLGETQTGWDWFSLAFDGGARMMGFRLRDTSGGVYSSATWIDADGRSTPFPDGALHAIPLEKHTVAGRDVPVAWQVQLPEKNVDLRVEALNRDAWMDLSIPYWEGSVRVTGSHSGRGYLEMTGYE